MIELQRRIRLILMNNIGITLKNYAVSADKLQAAFRY